MKKNKILILASRMGGEELVLLEKKSKAYETLTFGDIDEVRKYFSEVRNVLTEMPPKDFEIYTYYLRMMTILRPVIIELDEENAIQVLKANGANFANGDFVEFELGTLCRGPMYIAKMKKPFVKKRQVMDLMEDIQSTLRVGADGNINVNIIKEVKGAGKIASEEDVRKILIERGLL